MCDNLQNKYLDEQIRELLDDPVIIRIAKVIGRVSLSILELQEYGLTQKEVNHAIANAIISFDKPTETRPNNEHGVAAAGDYYFNFLSRKVKLTELGLFILQHITNL